MERKPRCIATWISSRSAVLRLFLASDLSAAITRRDHLRGLRLHNIMGF